MKYSLRLMVSIALVVALTVAIKHRSAPRVAQEQQTTLPQKAVPPVLVSTPQKPSQICEKPVFVEVAGTEKFSASYKTYAATVSAQDGLRYRPADLQTDGKKPELQVRLQHVACGKTVLFDRNADKAPQVASDEHGVCFKHASRLEERYTARGDGIEQSFSLQGPPVAIGDLEFECAVDAIGMSAQSARPNRGGGVSFFDEAGHFGVRYGQVSVHDAAHHGINLQPELDRSGKSVHFAIPAAWLQTASFPIVIDPLVGSDFQVSPDNPNGVAAPAVVAGTNNFLIVWDDFTAGTSAPHLLAAIATQTGVISPPFQISSNSTAPRPYLNQRTEAAFDGNNWFVVWAEDELAGSAIHGVIISGGGGANPPAGTLLGGTDFLIAATSGTVEEQPLATFDGTDFMVAWMSGPTGGASNNGSQIYYTRVSSAGAVSPVGSVPSAFNPPSQQLLFLTPQLPGGPVLLIYRESKEIPSVTRATRIGTDGTLQDVGGIALFTQAEATGGFGLPIGCAFNNNQWNILSSFDETLDSAVFQTTLSTAGVVTPPTGPFAIVGLGPTGTSVDQFAPVFSGPSGWLFLRNERVNGTVYHILGKRVGYDGTDQDPLPFQLDTATQGILRNAVAQQSGNVFLAAWLDGRRSAAQPADAINIFGAIIDTTVADTGGPPLVPVISASPTSGSSPLTVNFDSTGSTGSFDSLTWNFGDGAKSTAPTTSHTYSNNGTYIAQLVLAKGSYEVFRTVVITVGQGSGNTGPNGGTIVGTPVQNSGDLVSSLLISSANINLDFTSQRNDNVTVTGTIDSNAFPNNVTGTNCSVSISSIPFQFTLDAKGTFNTSSGSAPMIAFTSNQKTGTFTFQATKADLQAPLAALGATNADIHPATFVSVPITVAIGNFSATVTVGVSYKASLNQNGKGVYSFLGNGKTITGAFIVTKFSAKEGASNGGVHEYQIRGQIVRPNGGSFKRAPIGDFTFGIGNFSVSVPSGQFIPDKSGNLKFKARQGTVGLRKFVIAPRSGIFNMSMDKIPATGSIGSGLPLSGTNVTNVDLAFSFTFDLADGQVAAGRYIFITRKSASAKSWKLQ